MYELAGKLLISIFLLLLTQVTFGQKTVKNPEDCDNGIKFHYLIARDVTTRIGKPSEKFRQIWVFLDERAFAEENLKLLFSYLSKKYPSPNTLEITVETTWDRVPNPDDCEGDGISGGPDREDVDDYHWAFFMRRGKNEIFRYNPILKKPNIETVVLKGDSF